MNGHEVNDSEVKAAANALCVLTGGCGTCVGTKDCVCWDHARAALAAAAAVRESQQDQKAVTP
jgi:hypothetical protein